MTATQPNATAPATVGDVREHVDEAASRQQGIRIVGGGSWLDANRPVRAGSTLSVAGLGKIVEYEPGDLTLTAQAGVSLEAIAGTTKAHGQWLALDPPGDPRRATIGATIATGAYGPLAHQFGTPRDMTLGVEFVTGTARIVRGGGRVVKNVAGFDLTRLVTGAWGSLGVITEVTVRLRAIPAVEATIALEVSDTGERIDGMRRALRALPFVPLAAHWLDATLARLLDVDASGVIVLVRIGGNQQAVRAQRASLQSLGAGREVDGGVWDRLRVVEPARSASLRLSRLPSDFATSWAQAGALASDWPGAYRHGDAGRGVVRCVLPLGDGDETVRLSALVDVPFDGARIVERLPAAVWARVHPSLRSSLEQRIKAAFDPRGVLNPGILGESQ